MWIELKETSKIHFRLTFKDAWCLIFSIVYVLQKYVKWEGFFDKNLLILETNLNVLKNVLLRVEREVQFPWETSSSLYPACSELHREEPSSQGKLSLQKQCSLGSDLRKAVNSCVPDKIQLWHVFFVFSEAKCQRWFHWQSYKNGTTKRKWYFEIDWKS